MSAGRGGGEKCVCVGRGGGGGLTTQLSERLRERRDSLLW